MLGIKLISKYNICTPLFVQQKVYLQCKHSNKIRDNKWKLQKSKNASSFDSSLKMTWFVA